MAQIKQKQVQIRHNCPQLLILMHPIPQLNTDRDLILYIFGMRYRNTDGHFSFVRVNDGKP